MLVVLMAAGCSFDPHDSLRSVDAGERLRAVVWMDRAEMVADLPELIRMAAADPAIAVRREVIRELGWTRDPRVLPVLLAHAGAFPSEVLQSFVAWGGAEGCARAARIEIPHDERVYRWYLASPCFSPTGAGDVGTTEPD